MTLKRKLMAAATGAVLAPVAIVAIPQAASAHGYVSSPPSRQANCAQGKVAGCGNIVYEPQSVEGPKGLRSCNADLPQFAELNDDSKSWPAASVGGSATFSWTFTARHRTTNYEYYIGGTKVGDFSGNNAQPEGTVTHTVDLSKFSGRQKLLAIWNIADTPMAFYSCIDLQVGGGNGGNTDPAPTKPPTTTQPPTSAPPATSSKPPASGSWAAGTAYTVGTTVTYEGVSYRNQLAHTALPGWEPSNTPALWVRQ